MSISVQNDLTDAAAPEAVDQQKKQAAAAQADALLRASPDAQIVVGPNSGKVNYENQANYLIDGGTLNLDTSAGLLGFGKTSNAYANVGTNGGTVNVDLDSSIFSGFSGNYEYILNINNIPPEKLLITFDLSAPSKKATISYDGLNTTVKIKVVGGFIITSSITVYIVIPGNPNNMPTGTLDLLYSGNTGQVIIRCYAAGTKISIPGGEINVEDLEIGRLVTTVEGGHQSTSRVKWVGKRTVIVSDDDDRLVRIKRGAFSTRVPENDLLVTPEHCLFIEGRFIPARMLVNGSSIVLDEAEQFEVYHFELEKHSVVTANGLLSESYLDTGHKDLFTGHTLPYLVINGTSTPIWGRDSAAPLCTERKTVETLFNELAARAKALGFVDTLVPHNLTPDPQIRIVLEDGSSLTPIRVKGTRFIFKIPANTSRVWIASRHSRPCDIEGPFVDDRRKLGVSVGSVSLFTAQGLCAIDTYMDEFSLEGWHPEENESGRWTDGYAELPLTATDSHEPAILSLEIFSQAHYLEQPEEIFV
ncbi:Hint domain-containing protein [Asaia sp. HN010]|uniref:Hint domain-containing protein n=1 Tax=Asaia sp. HN010 TaxID=3081233 RepID=UPI00301A5123